jgi:hypothetical protein
MVLQRIPPFASFAPVVSFQTSLVHLNAVIAFLESMLQREAVLVVVLLELTSTLQVDVKIVCLGGTQSFLGWPSVLSVSLEDMQTLEEALNVPCVMQENFLILTVQPPVCLVHLPLIQRPVPEAFSIVRAKKDTTFKVFRIQILRASSVHKLLDWYVLTNGLTSQKDIIGNPENWIHSSVFHQKLACLEMP